MILPAGPYFIDRGFERYVVWHRNDGARHNVATFTSEEKAFAYLREVSARQQVLMDADRPGRRAS